MARKKKDEQQNKKKIDTSGVVGLVGSTTEQAISETLEINYMPYAMSVIVSRAVNVRGFDETRLLPVDASAGDLDPRDVAPCNRIDLCQIIRGAVSLAPVHISFLRAGSAIRIASWLRILPDPLG